MNRELAVCSFRFFQAIDLTYIVAQNIQYKHKNTHFHDVKKREFEERKNNGQIIISHYLVTARPVEDPERKEKLERKEKSDRKITKRKNCLQSEIFCSVFNLFPLLRSVCCSRLFSLTHNHTHQQGWIRVSEWKKNTLLSLPFLIQTATIKRNGTM